MSFTLCPPLSLLKLPHPPPSLLGDVFIGPEQTVRGEKSLACQNETPNLLHLPFSLALCMLPHFLHLQKKTVMMEMAGGVKGVKEKQC